MSKEGDDVLAPEQAVQLLSSSTLDQYNVDNVAKLTKSNVVSIWCDEKHTTGIEVGDMANVRVKTKGSGPYLGKIDFSFPSLHQGTFAIKSYSSPRRTMVFNISHIKVS